jgi:chorismate mutase/prephenate dehydrogenase
MPSSKRPAGPEALSTLREAIADVDRALLELLRRRLDLAAEVGRVKARSGVPVVVREVEDQVLERARRQAAACGVSESVMDGVFQAILRGAVERQYRVGIDLREARGGRVLVVGGAGGMGSWLRGFLELVGYGVELLDPSFAPLPPAPGRYAALDAVADLDAYEALIVAAPLASTGEAIAGIAARRPRGTIVEIASIKAPAAAALAAARAGGARAIALHPMFGPGKSYYEPMTFVLAALGDAEAERAALAPLLAHPYVKLVTVPFLHHDRLMGWLLGLAHLSSLLFGVALSHSGVAPEELAACASTTFTRQSATALSVLAEDPDLYLDIQHLNPHRAEVYAAAREALGQLESLTAGRDREGFRAALEAARRAIAG